MRFFTRLALPACLIALCAPPGLPVNVQAHMTPPDFHAADAQGQTYRLSDVIGKKVVLLAFMTTWCGDCRPELHEMSDYYEAHKSDVIVLGVDTQESTSKVKAFIDQMRLTFPVLSDADGSITQLYNVKGWPTNFIIGYDGKVFTRINKIADLNGLISRALETRPK